MNSTRALVAEAIAATRIHPPARFSWFGAMSARLNTRTGRTLSSGAFRGTSRGPAVRSVVRRLLPPRSSRAVSLACRQALDEQREVEAALSAANGGDGYLDEGWQVRETDRYCVVVVKNGLDLTARVDELS
jgi:hypothetical protein